MWPMYYTGQIDLLTKKFGHRLSLRYVLNKYISELRYEFQWRAGQIPF